MKKILEKYFGNDKSIEERLLLAATFMSAVASLLFFSMFLLLQVTLKSGLVFLFISLFSSACFFLEFKFKKTQVLSIVFLVVCNFFFFPYLLFASNRLSVEVPIYFLIGLSFSIVLLKGEKRYIYFFTQMIFDLVITYYCFVIKPKISPDMISERELIDYVRIEIAVITTGLLPGFLIKYRNILLMQEMNLREEANANAEKVSFAKDMFLVNVSHEIRTPLNAVIGTTELLLDSDVSNHIKEMSFNISNSSHALLSITSDLLDFSRMNIDSLRPVEEKYDVAYLLNDIINLMSVRLLDSNLEFYVRVNPDLPKLLIGDQGKIRQIIINLLSNAIKFTKEGYMALNVDFEYKGRDKVKLLIEVKDTGCGIAPENMDKIFEDVSDEGELTEYLTEGNGLGLALCRKLATAMDGRIYAESVLNTGSTFYFDVEQSLETPYVGGIVGGLREDDITVSYLQSGDEESNILKEIFKSMSLVANKEKSDYDFVEACKLNRNTYYILDTISYERVKEQLIAEEIDWNKIVVISDCNYTYSGEPFQYVLTKPVSCLNVADLFNHTTSFSVRTQKYSGSFTMPEATILVVDDNLVNLEVAAGLLNKYGCKVITAASGKECLITLKAEKVDLVFLDYMMPEMDGIDTLKEIRKLPDEKFKTLPVITLTANVVSGAREMFLDAGFDDYLSKPIETDKMEKAIIAHLPSNLVKFTLN